MKRKFIIVLVAQTVLIIVFFTFALIQKAEADKQRKLAVELTKRAEEERFNPEKIRMRLDSLKEN
jgi:predicted Holliday junction resolvase-like endonuclease